MKSKILFLSVVCWMLSGCVTKAVTYYVNINNPSPTPPFADWGTAATNIQDAIDAAGNGDTVLVTNGVYGSGGRVMAGDLLNRVALTNALTVQSVNGPFVTVIQGAGDTNGTTAVRCAWLTNGAALVGFTLTGGATRTTGDTTTLESGGGVWCASSNSLVSNCLIVSNNAATVGGGAYQGKLENSLISSNRAGGIGATYLAVLVNCTVASNATTGAASPLAMTNCIIYYNNPDNYASSIGGTAFSHCCITPLIAGVGNFTTAPQFISDSLHLANNSPCIGTGINVTAGTDIFGSAWSNPPSVGCAEPRPEPIVTPPQLRLTGSPVGFAIGNETVAGIPPYSFAWFKNGLPLQDDGHFSSTQTSNLVATGVSFADAGGYQVVVRNAFGVVTSGVAQLVIHCVDVAGTNPVPPYTNWATAATNIQDAIAISAAPDIVLVANGIYAHGGKSADGALTNRVMIDRPILVQSVNGPGTTIIQGAWNPTTTNGTGAIRCAWLTNNAILCGFMLCGGATLGSSASGDSLNGGGIWGAVTNGQPTAILFNCTISNNIAYNTGGGAYQVVLNNCRITANAAAGVANRSGTGGGAGNCVLKNCSVTRNYAYLTGGATSGGSLVNCTVFANKATGANNTTGAGVYGASLTNCIIFRNGSNYASIVLNHCCASPLNPGPGNVDVDPQLLADEMHLAINSPCIGIGTGTVTSGTDIDGQPWGNPPSMGCDEWQPAPVISIPPAGQVNFPTHGLTLTAVVAGQPPFNYFWSKDGGPIQDGNHYNNSGSSNLIVTRFGPDNAGAYQIIITNAYGAATSQVAQIVIHTVDAAGTNPIPPYMTWATAATNIQDAINAAVPGDIVLVTNGVYGSGGKVMSGNLTNRIAIDRAITVMSVNGYAPTIIQGAWDPVSTNGPGAVRCALVSDGATLLGFTLQNGATRAAGDPAGGGPLESGGGVWCTSTNGVVANCMLTNNSAVFGGGIAYGTLNNSYVTLNTAATCGGGAYYASLKNCTVVYNYIYAPTPTARYGAGTYNGTNWNSIVFYNNDYYYDFNFYDIVTDNYYYLSTPQSFYTCTSPLLSGAGNINAYPQFPDSLHLAATSPCRGAGSAAYANGTDLDDEPWSNPPSMGCEEVVSSNLVGPLSVSVVAYQTNVIVNHYAGFAGYYTGHASGTEWFFGDGQTLTNTGPFNHLWTTLGDYAVIYTVYNNEYPSGVSVTNTMHVQPLNAPQLQIIGAATNGFQFQFSAQWGGIYTVQYATNIIPPIPWKTLQVLVSTSGVMQVTDPNRTDMQRFYHVSAQ